MKIVVTGASGYMGSHIVKKILDRGHEVIAVDLKYDQLDERAICSSVNIFDGDELIFEKLGSPDVCLHLAWKDGFAHNSQAHLENFSAHYIFIRNMLKGGLKHIAVMGSMHEIGYHEGAVDENTPTNPLSYYGVAKNALREATILLCKENNAICQWLRAYYILGDDLKNNSIFSKICKMEEEGQTTFPFVSGKNKYDFLNIEDLAEQIVATITQSEINGIINCCSGEPVSLADKVEEYISEHNFNIKPDFGKFPEREYDSPAIWGDDSKIKIIMNNQKRK